MKKTVVTILMCTLLLIPSVSLAHPKQTCSSLELIFGQPVQSEQNICKLDIKRPEIRARLLGQTFGPEMIDLSFETNFKTIGTQTYVIGEFALLEPEIQRVIDALRSANLQVSALHNHWVGEDPRIFYLHFQGIGNQRDLALGIKKAIQQTTHFMH